MILHFPTQTLLVKVAVVSLFDASDAATWLRRLAQATGWAHSDDGAMLLVEAPAVGARRRSVRAQWLASSTPTMENIFGVEDPVLAGAEAVVVVASPALVLSPRSDAAGPLATMRQRLRAGRTVVPHPDVPCFLVGAGAEAPAWAPTLRPERAPQVLAGSIVEDAQAVVATIARAHLLSM
jgi:hypothetical protein